MSLKVVLPFAIDLIVSNLDICWLQFQNTHKAGSVLFKCNWATHIVFHLAWFFSVQSEDSFSKNICSPVLAKASVSFGLGRVLDVGVIEQVLRRYVKTGSREVHHKPLWSSRSLFGTWMPRRICLTVMAGRQSFSSSRIERHTWGKAWTINMKTSLAQTSLSTKYKARNF